MSRSRRQRATGVGVSLFPFLAVLICTMGALIVLLVITVQQSGKATRALAEAQKIVEPPPVVVAAPPRPTVDEDQLQELHTTDEDLHYHIEMLTEGREKTLKRLQDQQAELGMVEDQSRDLQSKLERLRDEVELLKSALRDGLQQQDGHQQRLAAAEAELAAATAELEHTRSIASESRRSYALVAYEGAHGTNRRPIFLECTEEHVTLQPHGVKLTAEDLRPPWGQNNVLAAALRAVREYLLDVGLTKSSSEAYPLMVIRPGGEFAYDACRSALTDWDHDFGYELIPSDMELAYPESDPAVTELVERTVRDLRRIRAQLAPPPRAQRELDIWSPEGGFTSTAAGSGRDDGESESKGTPSVTGTQPSTVPAKRSGPPMSDLAAINRDSGFSVPKAAGTSNTGSDNSQDDDYQPRQTANNTLEKLLKTAPLTNSSSSARSEGGASEAPAGGPANASGDGGSNAFGLDEARGADWALPERAQGAIGVVRPVRLTCTEQELILHPESSTGQLQASVSFDESVSSATEQLVVTLRQRMEQWGIAGTGMYWRPVLDVEVTPDGQGRFHQLSAQLHGSGLEIRRR